MQKFSFDLNLRYDFSEIKMAKYFLSANSSFDSSGFLFYYVPAWAPKLLGKHPLLQLLFATQLISNEWNLTL